MLRTQETNYGTFSPQGASVQGEQMAPASTEPRFEVSINVNVEVSYVLNITIWYLEAEQLKDN